MPSNNKSLTSRTRPEVELLLCCARTYVDSERASRIKTLLRQSLDWAYLLDLAFRHALVPLLYYHLHAVGSEHVPTVHLQRLQSEFDRNAARNILLTHELCRILEVFEKNKIPVIPYKGPVLAITGYGDTSLRQFSDLDLMVQKQDVKKAAQLLLSVGYKSIYQTTDAPVAAYLQSLCEHPFSRDNGNYYVEIHWAFAPKYLSPTLDGEVFWSRLEKIPLGGGAADTLSVEDLLLVLCTHAGKHQWERLSWVCDIAETINASAHTDWEQLFEMGNKTGTRRMIFLGLFLANDLLGSRLPDAILQRIHTEPAVKSLAKEVCARAFSASYASLTPSETIRFNYRVRERARDGIRQCYYLIVPPTPAELTSAKVPNAFSFFYYLIRPVRLIKKHAVGYMKKLYRQKL